MDKFFLQRKSLKSNPSTSDALCCNSLHIKKVVYIVASPRKLRGKKYKFYSFNVVILCLQPFKFLKALRIILRFEGRILQKSLVCNTTIQFMRAYFDMRWNKISDWRVMVGVGGFDNDMRIERGRDCGDRSGLVLLVGWMCWRWWLYLHSHWPRISFSNGLWLLLILCR